MIKLVILPKTRSGMSNAELRHHLEHVHAPLCMRMPGIAPHFRRYVHHYTVSCPAIPGYLPLPDHGAITFICFDDAQAMAASRQSRDYLDAIGPDEDNFRDAKGSVTLFAREHAVIGACAGNCLKAFVFRTTQGADSSVTNTWADRLEADLAPHMGKSVNGFVVNSAICHDDAVFYDQFDEIHLNNIEDFGKIYSEIDIIANNHFKSVKSSMLITDCIVFK